MRKEKMMSVFTERRFWAALLPVLVIVSGALGVPVTEDVLAQTGDKVVAGTSALLALWSLFFPKKA
jgi:hypothetical protein